ncbi:hypothetical protein KIN20_015957 [Parelaphostrongylus tenuis]|uniref:Uncharacterized protein n=1 Tax=Parelaphostrongylus tenuis TaxID=148309 RepID=A0AAD5QPE4_PARTN|nr:hypothetical protein KIN20_015957 [Parelaphostrongylus tenuis]
MSLCEQNLSGTPSNIKTCVRHCLSRYILIISHNMKQIDVAAMILRKLFCTSKIPLWTSLLIDWIPSDAICKQQRIGAVKKEDENDDT